MVHETYIIRTVAGEESNDLQSVFSQWNSVDMDESQMNMQKTFAAAMNE